MLDGLQCGRLGGRREQRKPLATQGQQKRSRHKKISRRRCGSSYIDEQEEAAYEAAEVERKRTKSCLCGCKIASCGPFVLLLSPSFRLFCCCFFFLAGGLVQHRLSCCRLFFTFLFFCGFSFFFFFWSQCLAPVYLSVSLHVPLSVCVGVCVATACRRKGPGTQPPTRKSRPLHPRSDHSPNAFFATESRRIFDFIEQTTNF